MGFYDILAMSLLTTIPILYTFPMILAHFFKIQGYKITDQTECNQLISKLNIRRSVFYHNGKPFGVFYGKWYIGYISSNDTQHGNQGHTMYLIIQRRVYEGITEPDGAKLADVSASSSSSSASNTKHQIIHIRERRGNPW